MGLLILDHCVTSLFLRKMNSPINPKEMDTDWDRMVPNLFVALQKYRPLSVTWLGSWIISWPPLMVILESASGLTSFSINESFR